MQRQQIGALRPSTGSGGRLWRLDLRIANIPLPAQLVMAWQRALRSGDPDRALDVVWVAMIRRSEVDPSIIGRPPSTGTTGTASPLHAVGTVKTEPLSSTSDNLNTTAGALGNPFGVPLLKGRD